MNVVNHIVIHCSATKENVDYSEKDLARDHRKRGFRKIGYHRYIRKDGSVIKGRALNEMGAHVKGHNHDSIGICYEGGLDMNGTAKDTRTTEQKESIIEVLREVFEGLKKTQDIKHIDVMGHRDLSPDLDGDGVIEKHEWLKLCPCFDAKKEYRWVTGLIQ